MALKKTQKWFEEAGFGVGVRDNMFGVINLAVLTLNTRSCLSGYDDFGDRVAGANICPKGCSGFGHCIDKPTHTAFR